MISFVKSSFFQRVKVPYFPHTHLERLIHAFIISRLDYCNSSFISVGQHLLVGADSSCPVLNWNQKLASFHWLPDGFRVDFKILMMVFKVLNAFKCITLFMFMLPSEC